MKKITFEEAIKEVEDGKKVYDNIGRYYIYNENNKLCLYNQKDKMVEYSTLLLGVDDYFIPEEPKPFEITKTGLYRTRDGLKVFISTLRDEDNEYAGVVEGDFSCNFWKYNGKVNTSYSDKDIISKWED